MPCGSWLRRYCLARTSSPHSLEHSRALATWAAGALPYALQPPPLRYHRHRCRRDWRTWPHSQSERLAAAHKTPASRHRHPSLSQQQCHNSTPFLFRCRRKYSYLKATLNARCRIKCPYSTSNRRKREEVASKRRTGLPTANQKYGAEKSI